MGRIPGKSTGKTVIDMKLAATRLIAEHGFEGTIIRNPRSVYKAGRSTQEGQLWRVKPWGDFESIARRE